MADEFDVDAMLEAAYDRKSYDHEREVIRRKRLNSSVDALDEWRQDLKI